MIRALGVDEGVEPDARIEVDYRVALHLHVVDVGREARADMLGLNTERERPDVILGASAELPLGGFGDHLALGRSAGQRPGPLRSAASSQKSRPARRGDRREGDRAEFDVLLELGMDIARERQQHQRTHRTNSDAGVEAVAVHLADVAVDRDAEIRVERRHDPVLVVDLPGGDLRLDDARGVPRAKVERVGLLRLHYTIGALYKLSVRGAEKPLA